MSYTSSHEPSVVVVTGMHRSGTSLTANLLRHSGLYLGDSILEPDGGNPLGYFEDSEILQFHNGLLDRADQSYLVKDPSTLSGLCEQARLEAAKLVTSRRGYSLWGFKDPRACLFLNLWVEVVANARFVFVYRDPLEVVLSLLRRGRACDLEVLSEPLSGLRSWQVHNDALLDFYQRHRDRSHLANIWSIVADPQGWVAALASKLDLPIGADASRSGVSVDSLHRLDVPNAAGKRFAAMAPDAAELYRRLEIEADCPGEIVSRRKRRRRSPRTFAESRAREPLSEALPVLLAELDPKTVCLAKRSLDRLRTAEIASLWARVSELELRTAEAEDKWLRERQHKDEIALLSREAAKHLDERARRADELERRLNELQTELAGLQGQLDERNAFATKRENVEIRRLEEITNLVVAAERSQWIIEKEMSRAAELEQALSGMKVELKRAHDRTGTLETALMEKKKELAKVETLHSRLRNQLARDNGTLRAEVRGKDDSIRSVQAHLAVLEKLLAQQEAQTMRADLKINSIERTRAWQWALKWYAFRRFVGGSPSGDFGSNGGTPATIEAEGELSEDQADEPSKVVAKVAKVLFISHDAKRHGAQNLLLHFLRWLEAHTSIPFEILLKEDGELRPQFEALAPVTLWTEGSAKNRALLGDAPIELIYSNTATNGKVLEALSDLNCPVVCHVHELDYCLNYQTERGNLEQVERHADHYIAVSQAVKESLIRTLDVSEERLDVVQEFIPTDVSVDPRASAAIRDRLGIREDALVVGASGTTDWRKGPDLFVQLAQRIRQKSLGIPVHFVWVGGEQGGPTFAALWHDVELAGLDSCMIFTGSVDDPFEHYSIFDVFTLMSREDPFPLVSLEVASLAKPIICFDGAGGAREFVEQDCGFVVPYLDIDAMASRVIDILESPALRASMGKRAREKVRERNDVTRLAPRILSIIKRFTRAGAVATVS